MKNKKCHICKILGYKDCPDNKNKGKKILDGIPPKKNKTKEMKIKQIIREERFCHNYEMTPTGECRTCQEFALAIIEAVREDVEEDIIGMIVRNSRSQTQEGESEFWELDIKAFGNDLRQKFQEIIDEI